MRKIAIILMGVLLLSAHMGYAAVEITGHNAALVAAVEQVQPIDVMGAGEGMRSAPRSVWADVPFSMPLGAYPALEWTPNFNDLE